MAVALGRSGAGSLNTRYTLSPRLGERSLARSNASEPSANHARLAGLARKNIVESLDGFWAWGARQHRELTETRRQIDDDARCSRITFETISKLIYLAIARLRADAEREISRGTEVHAPRIIDVE